MSILPVNSCASDEGSGEIWTVQTDWQQMYATPDRLLRETLSGNNNFTMDMGGYLSPCGRKPEHSAFRGEIGTTQGGQSGLLYFFSPSERFCLLRRQAARPPKKPPARVRTHMMMRTIYSLVLGIFMSAPTDSRHRQTGCWPDRRSAAGKRHGCRRSPDSCPQR